MGDRMDQQSEPVLAQPGLVDKRRALFAAAGERIYLMEKLQIELNAIRAELDKEQPAYPPKIPIPEPTPEPEKEAPPTTG